MTRIVRWGAIVLGAVVALAAGALLYVYIASEIALTRTYAVPPSAVRAAIEPAAVERGAHLAKILGCASCHGDGLAGTLFDDVPGMAIWSSNLPLQAKTYADADFDRAIRQGLRADGTSVVLMPSNAYAGLRDDEVAAIVAYIRTLPPSDAEHPARRLGWIVRAALAFGLAGTARDDLAASGTPLDLGPQFADGRHLAQVGCGECHGGDLKGAPAFGPMPARPDLALVAAYERDDFTRLMRTGKAAGDRELTMMSTVSRARFANFTDAEIDALYAYLAARGTALVADAQ